MSSRKDSASSRSTSEGNGLDRRHFLKYDRQRCLDLVETMLEEIVVDRRLKPPDAAEDAPAWATFGLARAGSAAPAATPTLSSRAPERVRALLWRTPA
jgi:hypothetical protein